MSNSKQPNNWEFTKKLSASNVWNNFMATDDRRTAKCKLCAKIIKTGGGSTSGLHTHMRTMHKDIKESSNQIGDIPISSMTSASSASSKTVEPSAKKVNLPDYFLSQNSIELTVTRMVALDGIPLSKFCTSTDLRRLFSTSGYKNLPRSPTTITNIILKESDNVKNNVKKTFADLKKKVQRFALTFDEYTSTNNKRYMNINVHNKDFDHCKFKNLGLVRISGSLNATAGMKYLKDRLQDFDLDLDEDIIAFTTDGASVMIKMGKDFKGHHQLCLAHGIQLAVIDVLYKNKFQDTPATVSAIIWPEMDIDDSDDDNDYNLTNEDDSYNILPRVAEAAHAEGLRPEFIYKDLVKEVRTLVKLFRKSPTKNDMLQQYVAENNQGHTEELILDCKTRWSSLSDMIGRFLKLKSSIAKVLIDLHFNFPLDDRSVEILQNVHTSLAVVKATVLAICRRVASY